MKNIIFIAPPAAGKGTISNMICSKYNIPHISIGEILRDEIAHCTKIGLQIKETMAKGILVNDEIITKLIRKRISSKDCKKGFIIDGYPRTINQAVIFDKLLEELSYDIGIAILLNISKEEALNRSMSRLICPKCNISYNTSNRELSPVREGICDNCSSVLKTRTDDTIETFENRYNIFINETYPLVEYYEKKNKLVRIDVDNKSPLEVFEEVGKVIK